MKYIKDIDGMTLFEKLRSRGREYDVHEVEKTKLFAGDEGMLIDNHFIPWEEIKRLYDRYNEGGEEEAHS